MIEEIGAFLNAIPAAAANPLALIAYLATVLAWTLIAWRVKRFQILMDKIEKLKEGDRLEAIRIETGRVVPKGMTAEQYLRSRIHFFIFAGFLALCATAVFVASMALIRVYEQKVRADGYINEILGQPSSSTLEAPSPYKSAINTLGNGRSTIVEGQAEIRPPLSKADLDRIVAEWQLQHLSPDQINDRFAEVAGTARLKRANQKLGEVTGRIEAIYEKLANCFRAAECRPGDQFPRMCNAVKGILATIDQINAAALAISGVNFNASGTIATLGGGSMDIDFTKLAAPNVTYLGTVVCDRR
ncbi:hypothetical protein QRQ56_34870 [Bradyrhizobium sp. U531]|uniref:hypothetical protein n=1 Tax=Bradyrhizobium sp. U531 TaxID=3053458 RepID=UPI003F429C45